LRKRLPIGQFVRSVEDKVIMISIGLKKKAIFTKMTLKFILINYRKMNGILSVVYMNKSMKLEKLVLMKQIGN
jgi:hypothetical protein